MDQKQLKQEHQYGFPYHHISSFENGHFSQTRNRPRGYKYIAYLEVVFDFIKDKDFTSLLDIGCGDGKFLYEARKKFPDVALAGNDYSEYAFLK
jgi:SAM-dependent methyltransferase